MDRLDTAQDGAKLLTEPLQNGVSGGFPLLLTEDELVALLRIPEVSKTGNHHYVIQNLMRMHDLPCIHISKTPLYPFEAVRQWILEKVQKERR